MEVNCIIKEDGFLIEEGTATDPEDSLLELEDEIQSVQIQRPKDKPKERQVAEQSLESQRKRRHYNSRKNEEQQPRKRTR